MRNSTPTARRGVALLTTVLLLTLLIAVGAELATVTATCAVEAARAHRGLAAELAVDSALLLLSERLNDDTGRQAAGGRVRRQSEIIKQLDQFGVATIPLSVGDVTVICKVRDDGAKINPNSLSREDQRVLLTRKLTMLAARRGMTHTKVAPAPIKADKATNGASPYRWYDQILADVEPGTLFDWSESKEDRSSPVWSDVVTFWGDGRVDLRRVEPDVLEVWLADLQPGLARSMLAARRSDRSINFLAAALVPVSAEVRNRVVSRITFDSQRYAIDMTVDIGGDRRRWYVVAELTGRELQVLHRSQLTW